MGIDNPKGKNNFWYKVLYDIDENGYYSTESPILSISADIAAFFRPAVTLKPSI